MDYITIAHFFFYYIILFFRFPLILCGYSWKISYIYLTFLKHFVQKRKFLLPIPPFKQFSFFNPSFFYSYKLYFYCSYFTFIRNNPSGGAIIPAASRDFASIISVIVSAFRLPRPTSTKVPVIIRTIF